MKTIPHIEKFMTTSPQTVGVEQTLSKAAGIMSDLRIRHLPVLSGGQLVGVISDRDIKMVSSLKDVDPDKTRIEEALTSEIYKVSPKTPLNEVCDYMADHKIGSALVVDNNRLVGIFTWVDALNALNELLETRLKK
ncbi:MAG: CBS domain-containing protein [Bdellovibrionaceae bacterium]|nr:CBS domain-containing protein [Pseudobdellovibrionaceae bacterium]